LREVGGITLFNAFTDFSIHKKGKKRGKRLKEIKNKNTVAIACISRVQSPQKV